MLHSCSNAHAQEVLPKINYTKNKLNIRELEILGSYLSKQSPVLLKRFLPFS